jgi:dUTP pyrophosphatase
MASTTGSTAAAADLVQDDRRNASSSPLLLKVKRLSPNAVLPSRASAHAAGYDLSSAVDTMIPARGRALVATDLSVAVPEGTYARIGT